MAKIDLSSVVAANIKAHMEARGLTQTSLAAMSSLSQKTISNLLASSDHETRPKSATLDSIEKVAMALKVTPWKLLMDLTNEQRAAWDSIEAAFNALHASPATPKLAATSHKANGTSGH